MITPQFSNPYVTLKTQLPDTNPTQLYNVDPSGLSFSNVVDELYFLFSIGKLDPHTTEGKDLFWKTLIKYQGDQK